MTARATDTGPRQLIRAETIEAHHDAAVNCAKCCHLGNFRADVQGGWCMRYRHMQSTWHQVACSSFQPEGSA